MRLLAVTLIIGFVLALTWAALGRDDGRYAQSPHRDWFRGLSSNAGGWCCDNADGQRVDDPDWEIDGDGYRVRLDGEWLHVGPQYVVTGNNRVGYAIVWPYREYPGGPLKIRCFLPGAGI